jgi:hypothetical protein
LKHVLNACDHALNSGRYRWRHDNVLSRMGITIRQLRPDLHMWIDLPQPNMGEPNPPDWFDPIGEKGSRRPDLVLWTRDDADESVVWIIELTVPYEDNIQAANDRKMDKYASLAGELQAHRRPCFDKVILWAVEVGARGKLGPTTYNFNTLFHKERDGGRAAGKLVRRGMIEEAVRCSHILYRNRDKRDVQLDAVPTHPMIQRR